MENKWEEGDKAVENLTGIFDKIAKSKKNYGEKITEISKELEKAANPWNLKGDDRVLSMMNNEACAAAEEIIELEIANIIKSPGGDESSENFESKEARLNKIRAEIEGISWLAEGFKSSLRVDIAFALSELKTKKW